MNANTVLDIFKEITAIPRESGHEEPMTAFLLNWAAERKLEAKRDAIGNVCITKAARSSGSSGYGLREKPQLYT